MRKSISKRNQSVQKSNPMISQSTILVILVIIGFAVFLYWKKKNSVAGTYNNLETWNVSYSKDGMPTKIEIHREAKKT